MTVVSGSGLSLILFMMVVLVVTLVVDIVRGALVVEGIPLLLRPLVVVGRRLFVLLVLPIPLVVTADGLTFLSLMEDLRQTRWPTTLPDLTPRGTIILGR
jgi:hypothetical protein